uniref:CHK domain-containing protein n=1 Tax=Bursaphelenchus xylophilus TaxID=6326 RepID=A0A1I7SGV4_BURXY
MALADCELAAKLGTDLLKFDGSEYTVKWLVDILKETHGEFGETLKSDRILHLRVDINDIGDGKGHLSKVYRAIFQFENRRSPLDVIVKFPVLSVINKIRKDAGMDPLNSLSEDAQFVFEAHNHECLFYEMMANADRDAPFVPKVFFIAETDPKQDIQGALVMESFFGRTGGLHFFDYVSPNQTMSIAVGLAKLHAFAYQLPGQPWRQREGEAFYTDRMVEAAERIEKAAVEYELKDFDKIQSIRTRTFFRYTAYYRSKELNAVGLVHGDCWGQNVLFNLNENGTVSDDLVAFIDFQMCNAGNSLSDLARWMTACVDADVRREITGAVLDTYYNTLVAEFSKYQRSGALLPSRCPGV